MQVVESLGLVKYGRIILQLWNYCDIIYLHLKEIQLEVL
jgi:hypothetical protein